MNNRMLKIDTSGNVEAATSDINGTQPGQFDIPHNIVMDDMRRLWVADRANKRIQVCRGIIGVLDALILVPPDVFLCIHCRSSLMSLFLFLHCGPCRLYRNRNRRHCTWACHLTASLLHAITPRFPRRQPSSSHSPTMTRRLARAFSYRMLGTCIIIVMHAQVSWLCLLLRPPVTSKTCSP